MRIDVCADAARASYERRNGSLAEAPAAPPVDRYDFAFVVHETAEAHLRWSRLVNCRRRARRVYLVDHAATYAAHSCDIDALVAQKAVLALRRCTRRVHHRLVRGLAALAPPLPADEIEDNERKLDSVRAVPPSELDERLGEGFRQYFGYGRGRDESQPVDFSHQAIHTAMVRSLVGPLEGKRILDLGSGFGIHALMLREVDNYVVGLDLVEARAKSLGRHGHRNLAGTLGVAEHLPFARESFDVVFAHDAIQHVCDIAATFRECHAVLRRGGACVISEVNPYHPDLYVCYGPFTPMRRGCRQLYADQRADYLRERAGMPAVKAARLAGRTESLTAGELDELIASSMSPRTMRALHRAQAARGEFTPWRAVDGWCEERYLRPAQIVSRLVRAGFQPSKIRTVCLGHDGTGQPHAVKAGPFLDVLFSRYMVIARR